MITMHQLLRQRCKTKAITFGRFTCPKKAFFLVVLFEHSFSVANISKKRACFGQFRLAKKKKTLKRTAILKHVNRLIVSYVITVNRNCTQVFQ